MRGAAVSDVFVEHAHERMVRWYLSIAMVGTALVIVGAWLPWQFLIPVSHGYYFDPLMLVIVYPTYASLFVVIPALVAAAAIVVAVFQRKWQPDLLFVAVAAPILYKASQVSIATSGTERYIDGIGLSFVLLGGLFLGTVGLLYYLLKLRLGRRVGRATEYRAFFWEFGIYPGGRNDDWSPSTDGRGNLGDVTYLSALGIAALLVIASGLVPEYAPSLDKSTYFEFTVLSYQAWVTLPAILVVACGVVSVFRDDWRPDVPAFIGAGIILYVSWATYMVPGGLDDPAVEPGIFLALCGGVLMAGVTLYSLWARYRASLGRATGARDLIDA